MTEFKIGDKVLVPATVTYVAPLGSFMDVEHSDGTVAGVLTQGVTLVPYQEPDLRPGMVVMSEDESDDRQWWIQEGRTVDLWFIPVSILDGDYRNHRRDLPDRIRVVWPT